MKTEMATIEQKSPNRLDKVYRDGKVAVLVSGGYGAGWYSWNTDFKQCLFCPEIVNFLIEKTEDESADSGCETTVGDLMAFADELFGKGFYAGGARDLRIEWVKEGAAFRIDEYDGNEALVLLDQDDVMVA